MFFKQYYLGCLSHASYMIGDEASGEAVVVDPQRDIDQYVADAESQGMRITRVILTHFHADFVAGHIELRDRVGAAIFLGARAEAEYPFTVLREGEPLTVGQVRLEALETPGHTPEGISILVYDLAQDAEQPYGVLTGDTLFIGDVGRPDLMASVGMSAEELAGLLYDSLHGKLLPLADAVRVYPAHGAGSLCGLSLSEETSSTMGVQRTYNYALQPMPKEAFIRLVTTDQPDAPVYFSYDAQMNRIERPDLESALGAERRALSLGEVLAAVSGVGAGAGAQLLDTREPGDFAAAHLAGSINVGLSGQFASWAGTVLDQDRPLVLVAEPGREEEALLRLGRIGFDGVLGYLEGGMAALAERPDLVERFDRLAPATLAERLAEPSGEAASQEAGPPVLVDVRAPGEVEAGAIAGSRALPLPQLRKTLDGLPREANIVVYCAGGYRSAIAVSVLQEAGFARVSDLAGGYDAWAVVAAGAG